MLRASASIKNQLALLNLKERYLNINEMGA
jgi:hypothetical protein